MKNNRNEVVVKIVEGKQKKIHVLRLWTENNRIVVEVEVEVVVQGKQTECGGGGGAVKTIVVQVVDGNVLIVCV